jgi:hypothetical protein
MSPAWQGRNARSSWIAGYFAAQLLWVACIDASELNGLLVKRNSSLDLHHLLLPCAHL